MTLAQRLLLSLSLVVIVATTALGWFVRQSWRAAEEAQFDREFKEARDRLSTQLDTELNELPRILEPLCEHSQMVDDPLTSLASGSIPPDRLHALSLLSRGTQAAYRFDEFVLFTSKGQILGAHDPKLVGSKDLSLALLEPGASKAEVTIEDGIPKVKATCMKMGRDVGVGLMAARHVREMLQEVGRLHGLELSLSPPPDATRVARLEVPVLSGFEVFASPRRSWLNEALDRATRAIVLGGAVTLAGAFFLAWLVARRIAVPIEQLADQVQHAVEGEPRRVTARGSRELVRFAAAFNQAMDDLQLLKKRLLATERIAAQREIARRVAHEIKNPLAPIRAAIETLRRLRRRADPNFDSYFDEATETVLSEVQRITIIVKEFTEFARMPAPRPAQVDLGRLISSVCGLHGRESVHLRVELADDLPQIRADRDQIVQVLTNLLVNALDALEGREDAKIIVATRVVGQSVELSVCDNGPGVPPALRESLFSPYVTGKSEGTGLGLSIAQKIVTEHGGNIEHTDAPGGGACFVIRLPVSGPVEHE